MRKIKRGCVINKGEEGSVISGIQNKLVLLQDLDKMDKHKKGLCYH